MTMTEQNTQTILIEIGTYLSRIGFVGEEVPRYIYRTDIFNVKDQFSQIFTEKLKVNPSEYQVVILKDIGTELDVLNKEADLLFDEFKVRGCAFMNAQTCIIFSWAHGYNGLIIDIGYNSTIAAPIINGKPINDLCISSNTAGKSIEGYIIKELLENETNFDYINKNKEEILKYLMESHFYFDCLEDDFEYQEIHKRKQHIEYNVKKKDKIESLIKINLPDPILPYDLLKNSKDSTEPSLNDCLIEVVNTSLTEILETIKNDKYGRIIFCGGGGQVLGLRSFLIRELFKSTELQKSTKWEGFYGSSSDSSIIRASFRNYDIDLKIVPSGYQSNSSWLGGSIIFSLKYAQDFFTSKQNYYDNKEKHIGFVDERLEAVIIKNISNSNGY